MKKSFFGVLLWGWLCLSAVPTTAWGLSFTDSAFENLEETTLREKSLLGNHEISSKEILSVIFHRYFLAEALAWKGKIHNAETIRTTVYDTCEAFKSSQFATLASPQERGQGILLCALALAERVHASPPLFRSAMVETIRSYLTMSEKLEVPLSDRLYVQGRVYQELPPGYGQEFSRAILALMSLKRLEPNQTSSDYWLFQAFLLQRNLARAETLKNELQGKTLNIRWHYFNLDHNLPLARLTEGAGFGWGVGVFYSPEQGIGGILGLSDDRVFDTMRSADLNFWATHRGNYGAWAKLRDFETLDSTLLTFSPKISRGQENFYGIGMNGLQSDATSLNVFRYGAQILATQFFSPGFYFSLGWKWDGYELRAIESGPLALSSYRHSNQTFHTGALGEFGFDSRDEKEEAVQGVLAVLKAYFPEQSLGSHSSFQEWTALSEAYTLVSPRIVASVHLGAVHVNGEVPFSAIPRLGGFLNFPGVRSDRFAARDLWGSWTEAKYALGSGAFSLGGFASAAGEILRSPVKFGTAAFLENRSTRFRKKQFRLEVGVFAGEFFVGGNAGFFL